MKSRIPPITIRQECWLVGAVVMAALIVCSVTLSLPAGSFNDDAVYLALGKSIAEGEGYRSLYLVDSPVQTKFPPLLPALLSLGWLLGGTVNAARILGVSVNIVACGFAAGFLWWMGRSHLRIPVAAMILVPVLGFLLDPSVQYFTLVLSEPLFICLTVVAIALYLERRPVDGRSAAMIGGMIAAAALARSQGMVLIPVFLLVLVVDRVPRRALGAFALTAILPLALWQGAIAILASGSNVAQSSERGYIGFLLSGSPIDVIRRELLFMWYAVRGYARMLALLVSDNVGAGSVLIAGLLAAVIAGVSAAWREARVLVLTSGALLAVALGWPVFGDRFLVPALPFVALLAAAGLGRWLRVENKPSRWAAIAVGLAFPAFILWRQQDIRTPAPPGTQSPIITPSMWLPGNAAYLQVLAEWTRRMTKPTDRIATASAAGLWLYSGRATEITEFAEPIGAPSVYAVPGRFLGPLLDTRRVDVVVVEVGTSGIAREVDHVMRSCPQALAPMPGFPGRDYPRFYRVTGSCASA